MTPQKATLDSLLAFSWFQSYRRLAPKFQHSLSSFTLGIYLGGFYMSPYQSRNKEGTGRQTDSHTELGLLWLSVFWSEVKFLDEIQTKVLKVFLLAIHSHLYSFALRFLVLWTHATSYNFYSSLLYTVKEKGGKPDRKPYPLPYGLRNPYRNLKSENSQDYASSWIWLEHITEAEV
jgi:hypothetical protein